MSWGPSIEEAIVDRWIIRTVQNVVMGGSSKTPGIEASIATQGENIGTGTPEGYVKLERPGKIPKVCAMTCHHVLICAYASPAAQVVE